MVAQFMVYSDQLIIPAIEALNAAQRPVTASEISRHSGVAYSTVKRRLSSLERAGIITRTGSGRRWGRTIEIVDQAATA